MRNFGLYLIIELFAVEASSSKMPLCDRQKCEVEKVSTIIEEIKQEILSRCKAHWANKRRAYLLAQVGIDLQAKTALIKRDTGKKLVEFIRDYMSDVVILESPSEGSQIFGIFPKDVFISTHEIKSLFEQIKKPESIRFNSRVWAAFTKPLQNGCHRLFLLDNMYFNDSQIAVPNGNKIVNIPQELIVSDENPNLTEVLSQNIMKWASDNHIPLDGLLVTRSEKGRHVSEGNSDVKKSTQVREFAPYDRTSLLDRLIEHLDSKDLSRVSLPLDIVQKLMGKKA